ncbi:Rieske Fe-S protein [Microbacterium sp. TS-1]|nr:Rieske Fe-S protein [Microbacterium sp. TS-1]
MPRVSVARSVCGRRERGQPQLTARPQANVRDAPGERAGARADANGALPDAETTIRVGSSFVDDGAIRTLPTASGARDALARARAS